MLFLLIALTDEENDILEGLFENHNRIMFNISFKITKSKDLSEEAVQEAFVRMMNNIDRIKNLPCPQRVPFCVVIVKNISLNMIRSQKQTASLEDAEKIPDDNEKQTENAFLHSEDINELRELLSRLPENDRLLIEMKWDKRMHYREIGAILGISEQSAMKRGQRILQKLKASFKKEGRFYE